MPGDYESPEPSEASSVMDPSLLGQELEGVSAESEQKRRKKNIELLNGDVYEKEIKPKEGLLVRQLRWFNLLKFRKSKIELLIDGVFGEQDPSSLIFTCAKTIIQNNTRQWKCQCLKKLKVTTTRHICFIYLLIMSMRLICTHYTGAGRPRKSTESPRSRGLLHGRVLGQVGIDPAL